MNERVTLITLFNQEELKKINNILKTIDEPLCKVPFRKNVEDRIKVDTLPYHLTLSSWSISKQDFIIQQLPLIDFKSFTVKIDGIDIIDGAENSFVLCFTIQTNVDLTSLQEKIYHILPNKFYDPTHFKFHITIAIDKDYTKILRIKDQLHKVFTPFELQIEEIGIFSIYPAKKILSKKCTNN